MDSTTSLVGSASPLVRVKMEIGVTHLSIHCHLRLPQPRTNVDACTDQTSRRRTRRPPNYSRKGVDPLVCEPVRTLPRNRLGSFGSFAATFDLSNHQHHGPRSLPERSRRGSLR